MKKFLGTLLAIGLVVGSGIYTSELRSQRAEPVVHHGHGDHWSIFSEIIPAEVSDSLKEAMGPTYLHGKDVDQIAHVYTGIVVLLFCLGLCFAAWRRLRRPEDYLLPPKRWGALAFFDILIDAVMGLMTQMMPRDKAIRFLPLVASFAVFILISNAMALIPGMLPPTDTLRTTLALGVVSFLAYNYWGIKQQGLWNYVKHFFGPIPLLAPLIFVIELISHFVRPLSLALRLMGNMYGDHQVLGKFLGFGLLLLPIPVMALGLMVIVVQALVFTLLTIVYIAIAVEDHDDHHAEHGASSSAH